MKTKTDRKMNKIAKRVNRDLKQDVFKDRFWVRQVCKQRVDGLEYYLYELKDRLEPERDKIFDKRWLWGGSCFLISDFFEEVNEFIIKSDFWELYRNENK